MFVKSFVESVAGIVPAGQLGLLWFWLAMAAFATALAAYRKSHAAYRAAAILFCLYAVARSAPFFSSLAGIPAFPLALLLAASSRAMLSYVTDLACDRQVHKAWRIMSYVTAGFVSCGAVAAFVLGPSRYRFIEAGAMALFAIQSLAATLFFARGARTTPSATRLIAGSVPWGVVWSAAATFSVLGLLDSSLGVSIVTFMPAATAAADGLMGVAILLAVMFELAKPAPEDTALDDYTTMVAASIKRFVPTEFLNHLQKTDFFDLRLGDHVKKNMTVFFSDIRAFTELSEQLTPEESFAFVNSYLSRVVPIINANGGFIDKYMGDGIMGLFADNRGADQAVESAVEIQKQMVIYNGHRANMNYRPISMGIGIHTGPLMLGVVGVSDRMEGTVISDAVNLSSRLQQIAKVFNIPLVISEQTFMLLEDPGKYKYRFIGKVRVRGKDAPISAFEIFDGLPAELFERKMRANTFFEQGMLAYYQKDYSQGVFYFKRALEDVHEDGASRFYLETCLRKTMAPKPVEKAAEKTLEK